ncbi:MAG TPA: hypothetical protein VGN51_22360 [Acidimicrobiia bacterium]
MDRSSADRPWFRSTHPEVEIDGVDDDRTRAFVHAVADRYRVSGSVRVDDELAQFLTGAERPGAGHRVRRRTALLVAALLAVGVAGAFGALPAAAQEVVADAAGAVGITIPSPGATPDVERAPRSSLASVTGEHSGASETAGDGATGRPTTSGGAAPSGGASAAAPPDGGGTPNRSPGVGTAAAPGLAIAPGQATPPGLEADPGLGTAPGQVSPPGQGVVPGGRPVPTEPPGPPATIPGDPPSHAKGSPR